MDSRKETRPEEEDVEPCMSVVDGYKLCGKISVLKIITTGDRVISSSVGLVFHPSLSCWPFRLVFFHSNQTQTDTELPGFIIRSSCLVHFHHPQLYHPHYLHQSGLFSHLHLIKMGITIIVAYNLLPLISRYIFRFLYLLGHSRRIKEPTVSHS